MHYETTVAVAPARARWGSAAGLVRWHLTAGRRQFGGLRGIDYSVDRLGRDLWRREETRALFALTARCLGDLDERSLRVLHLAYAAGESDKAIGEALSCSETTVRRVRHRALRSITSKAHGLRDHALELLREALIPEEG